MVKILLIGADGQLGQEVLIQLNAITGFEVTSTVLKSLDITNTGKLKSQILSDSFDYLINCTAYTAVDKAEKEIILAEKINTEAVRAMGEATARQNTKVIHISTDYVFDGKTHIPYSEETPPLPDSVYGKTKLKGEQQLQHANPQSIIIRTSWLYSENGNNFVRTMLRLGTERDVLKVVSDQIGTPTYAGDLAQLICHIINADLSKHISFKPGIYHFSNEGVASWYDFTLNIFQNANINCKVVPIESKDFPTAAPRPHYSVLNKTKIKDTYKIEIPHWQASLKKCLSAMKNTDI